MAKKKIDVQIARAQTSSSLPAIGNVPLQMQEAYGTTRSARELLLAGKRVEFSKSADAALRIIHVDWILEAVAAGHPVDIKNAFIRGTWYASYTQFKDRFHITASEIEDFADFSYSVFSKSVVFHETVFTNGATFESVCFKSDLSLEDCEFRCDSGNQTTVYFSNSRFEGFVHAERAHFLKLERVDFARSQFTSAFFTSAVFECEVDFQYARASTLSLAYGKFSRPCMLHSMNISETVSLRHARTARKAEINFRSSNIEGNLMCDNTYFAGDIDFGSSNVGGMFSVNDCIFLGKFICTGMSLNTFYMTARSGRKSSLVLSTMSTSRRLIIMNSVFLGDLNFLATVVGTNLWLEKVDFRTLADFTDSHIGRNFLCRNCKFADFRLSDVTINSLLDCSDVDIKGNFWAESARLASARFKVTVQKMFSLLYTRFNGYLQLSNSTFYGDVDLGGATVQATCSIVNAFLLKRDDAPAASLKAIAFSVSQQLNISNTTCEHAVTFYQLSASSLYLRQSVFSGRCQFAHMDVGSLHLSGAEFKGVVDFSGGSFNEIDGSPYDIAGNQALTFRDKVYFKDVSIKFLNVKKARFLSRLTSLYCLNMVIHDTADFTEAEFIGAATFCSCTVGSELLFRKNSFESIVDFRNGSFNNRVIFDRVTFRAAVDFSNSHFKGHAFIRCEFRGATRFAQCHFDDVADFSTRDFSPVSSNKVVSTTEFKSSITFESSIFAHSAQFGDVQFSEAVNFRGCRFNNLYLPETEEKANRLLPKAIDMQDCLYQSIEVHEKALLKVGKNDRIVPYARVVYHQLEKHLLQAGNIQGANDVYMLWREAERKRLSESNQNPSLIVSYLFWAFANYGVRPYRLFWFGFFLIIGGMFYFQSPGAMEWKDEKTEIREARKPNGWRDALGLSLNMFLPTGIPWSEDIVPSQKVIAHLAATTNEYNVVVRTVPSVVATFIKILGWILVPLGIAAASGILRQPVSR
jgi:uncharacterized protein YjbI with pentapeptide repeats